MDESVDCIDTSLVGMAGMWLLVSIGDVIKQTEGARPACDGAYALVTTTIKLRFDGRSTGVQRPFDSL